MIPADDLARAMVDVAVREAAECQMPIFEIVTSEPWSSRLMRREPIKRKVAYKNVDPLIGLLSRWRRARKQLGLSMSESSRGSDQSPAELSSVDRAPTKK